MSRVIVLNYDYRFLNTVSLRKAIKYIITKKAEIIKTTSEIIKNCDKTVEIKYPLVVRLIKMVRIVFKSKVPFSKKNIMARDGFKCQYCESTMNLSIDHIVPSSRGGKSIWENCVTACRKCNNSKGSRTPNEAKMKLLKIPSQPTIMEFVLLKMKNTGINEILRDLGVY